MSGKHGRISHANLRQTCSLTYPRHDRGTSPSKGRWCMNRNWPATNPTPGPSPTKSVRRWPTELGHPVEDVTPDRGFSALRLAVPRLQSASEHGLVSEEAVFNARLLSVARLLLPRSYSLQFRILYFFLYWRLIRLDFAATMTLPPDLYDGLDPSADASVPAYADSCTNASLEEKVSYSRRYPTLPPRSSATPFATGVASR